jgi:lysophospholipase L1-like esterase
MSNLALKDGDRYLFMGDSITDCGRRDDPAFPLGNGYPALVPGLVRAQAPALQVEWENRGIGGETLVELEARWENDCLALRPTWMSMLIGINDLHRYLFMDDARCNPEGYAARYEKLLGQVREATGCRFILFEPFFFTSLPGADATEQAVFESLPTYIEIVHQMAKKFDAKLIRTHEWGQEIIRRQGARALCLEPVHPHLTGHATLAQWVLDALQK